MKKCFLFAIAALGLMACQTKETSALKDEPYRPAYHHTPNRNWMNDPNGMFYDETAGVWHLYFQYNPYATVWGNMTWGHSTSKDLIHWTQQADAILPDELGMIFSGSVVIDRQNTAGFGENAVVAIYTSCSTKDEQRQSIAYSTDGGYTFTTYEGNPVLLGDIHDFRDPKVFWNETTGLWNMVLAAGQEVRFYSSPNLKEWAYLSSFGQDRGCHSGVWECPDLMPLPIRGTTAHKWLLIVNINPGGPYGGSATQYFVGEWDGYRFTSDQTQTLWMDYGKDHYATVSWHNAPDGRNVVLAWMSNWEYANQTPTDHFRSANSIPRDISLYQDIEGIYRVNVRPAKEVTHFGKRITLKPKKGYTTATLELYNQQGEKVLIVFDKERQTLTVDRTQAGQVNFAPTFSAVVTAPIYREVNDKTDRITIDVFVDNCSVEVFDKNGRIAITNLVFPTETLNQIKQY